MYPIDGSTASHASASIGPCSHPASASQVMPAARSRSGASGAASSGRRPSSGSAISSARARTVRSASGTAPSRRPCRRSRACWKSGPCHVLAASGVACTNSSTSAKRKSRAPPVSYFSSARSVYRRRTASARPRLTGFGSARPWAPVQYARNSPGSSARRHAAATIARLPPCSPSASRAATASAAATSETERMLASPRSHATNRAVHSPSATATVRTRVRKRSSRSPACS